MNIIYVFLYYSLFLSVYNSLSSADNILVFKLFAACFSATCSDFVRRKFTYFRGEKKACPGPCQVS